MLKSIGLLTRTSRGINLLMRVRISDLEERSEVNWTLTLPASGALL
ncbi:MAG: hypothetical protein UX78_C0013G0015 [Candidatus Amesbacteria bacterium GW2011_GWA2_47_11]|uniref:Uncharacterized protein n=1 Tax=Candidatus Amesbacteria bacterium GW2011_GWA2_47_11 TaxID=1618357 RepID=A0A0G1RFA8_9BACT|nr:MAG: hypothetical protein UX78_C0013G0015 [Candidatus Amesbacteria bacterium GW2011_GWA2_47_11]